MMLAVTSLVGLTHQLLLSPPAQAQTKILAVPSYQLIAISALAELRFFFRSLWVYGVIG